MSKLLPSKGLALCLTLGFGLVLCTAGCNSTESDSPESTATPASSETPAQDEAGHDHTEHGHGDHSHGDHDDGDAGHSNKTDMEKMNEALAGFSEEDRQSAMKQHFCPVSGEMLGTMGAPKKVMVEGRTVWICCDGCKDKLLAEPDKYLSKLDS